MTTEHQKQIERRYVDLFRESRPDWSEIQEGEKPDFRIRRASQPDIGLEVVEYHAESKDVPGLKRVAVEARWWKQLLPLLEQEREPLDALRGVRVRLQFSEPQVPERHNHQTLVRELIQIIQIAAERSAPGQSTDVVFAPQKDVGEANRLVPDYCFLPRERWPLASKYVNFLSVVRWPFETWMPWDCLNIMGAWVSPEKAEFARILQDKAEKAQNYDLAGALLRLLVVCETHGDLESHVFPRGDEQIALLEDIIRETGFDFANSPFAEVWLFSAFSGSQRRLYPTHLLEGRS